MSNILYILEDDCTQNKVYAKFFEKHDYIVRFSRNVKEYLKLVEEFGNPDVAILDYYLEIETCEGLLESIFKEEYIKVVLTSAYDDDSLRMRLYERGCSDVKPKHLMNELLDSIELFLEMESQDES